MIGKRQSVKNFEPEEIAHLKNVTDSKTKY